MAKKILIVVFLMVIFSGDQKPPAIETGEFPFCVIYEMNGEKYIIEDTVICTYKGLDYSSLSPRKPRGWNSYLKSKEEKKTILLEDKNVASIFKAGRINDEIRVVLHYGMGEYYMGDPNVKYWIHAKPHICYIEKYSKPPRTIYYNSTKLSEKELEKYFGIKIIEFKFSKPIKNTFK